MNFARELAPERFSVSLDVELRLCREDDLPALEWFGAFTHHRAIIRDAYELQGRGEALMLLAVADDFPIGQAWLDLRLKPDAEAPTVWAVRVMDPFQRLGVGDRLLAGLEELALARGILALEVAVETWRPALRRWYERRGWRPLRLRRESYSYVTPEGEFVTHALKEWVLGKRLAARTRLPFG